MQQVREYLRHVSIPRYKGSIHVLDQMQFLPDVAYDPDGTACDLAGAAVGVDIHSRGAIVPPRFIVICNLGSRSGS